jgi:hypothetical protein
VDAAFTLTAPPFEVLFVPAELALALLVPDLVEASFVFEAPVFAFKVATLAFEVTLPLDLPPVDLVLPTDLVLPFREPLALDLTPALLLPVTLPLAFLLLTLVAMAPLSFPDLDTLAFEDFGFTTALPLDPLALEDLPLVETLLALVLDEARPLALAFVLEPDLAATFFEPGLAFEPPKLSDSCLALEVPFLAFTSAVLLFPAFESTLELALEEARFTLVFALVCGEPPPPPPSGFVIPWAALLTELASPSLLVVAAAFVRKGKKWDWWFLNISPILCTRPSNGPFRGLSFGILSCTRFMVSPNGKKACEIDTSDEEDRPYSCDRIFAYHLTGELGSLKQLETQDEL